jgi:hypothetical protein
MKLAALFAFAPLAFAQAPPDVNVQDMINLAQKNMEERIREMKLMPQAIHAKAIVIAKKAPVCAIPLAQALPPADKTDYKMRTVKPAGPDIPKIGLDACVK